MGLRRRGAMGGARQGRRERSYPCDTGATEDAASRRPARPGDTTVHCGRSSDVLQSHAHDSAAALLQRCIVSRGLGGYQSSEAERPARDRKLVAEVVDDLDEEAGVRASLVQLAGRVQVARPESLRDDPPGFPRSGHERFEAARRLRIDERLDRHVVAFSRSGEQLVDRALGLELDLLALLEDRARPVFRLLDVRLIEGVDAEDRARDGRGELPAEELSTEVVRCVDPNLLYLNVGSARGLLRSGYQPF